MTKDEFSKDFATRLLESPAPKTEVQNITQELYDLMDQGDLKESEKDRIIETVRIVVQEELDRGQVDREVDEEELEEALDLLEKGQI